MAIKQQQHAGNEAAALLHEYVDTYKQRTKRTQKDIAKACNISPSMLSQMLAGQRPFGSRDRVKQLARVLQLSVKETDTLLRASGFAKTSLVEHDIELPNIEAIHELFESHAQHVAAPDRGVMVDFASAAVTTLVNAWTNYMKVRELQYQRNWEAVLRDTEAALRVDSQSVGDRMQQPMQHPAWYWELRRIAASYYAYMALLRAAAAHHTSDLDQAVQAAIDARQASEVAGDNILLGRSYVRLADIYKANGKHQQAHGYYQQALATLDPANQPTKQRHDLARHWLNRAKRKQAQVMFYLGESTAALADLRDCLTEFGRLGSAYEEIHTLYTLGVIHAARGNWEQSLNQHKRAVTMVDTLNDDRPWKDPRLRVEGYLHLAADHLDRHELQDAHACLVEVYQDLTDTQRYGDWGAEKFYEWGRFHCLTARRLLAEGSKDALSSARASVIHGLQFEHSEKLRSPVRIVQLSLVRGQIELRAQQYHDALRHFQIAETEIESIEPPMKSLLIEAQLGQYAATLHHLEESPVLLDQVDTKIEEQCTHVQDQRLLAQLALIRTERSIRMKDNRALVQDALVHHAALALHHAVKYNLFVAEQTRATLEQLFALLPHRQRVGVMSQLLPELRKDLPTSTQLRRASEGEWALWFLAETGLNTPLRTKRDDLKKLIP